jgi:hypothetical protein
MYLSTVSTGLNNGPAGLEITGGGDGLGYITALQQRPDRARAPSSQFLSFLFTEHFSFLLHRGCKPLKEWLL